MLPMGVFVHSGGMERVNGGQIGARETNEVAATNPQLWAWRDEMKSATSLAAVRRETRQVHHTGTSASAARACMALNGTDLELKCVAPCVFTISIVIAVAADVVVVAVASIAVAIAIAITAVAAATAASPACRPRRTAVSSCNGYSGAGFTTVVVLILLPARVLLVLSPHGMYICVVCLVNLRPVARWAMGRGGTHRPPPQLSPSCR